MAALHKFNSRQFLPCCPWVRLLALLIGLLCGRFDVLLAFNPNNNLLMPVLTDNGFSSAYTNAPVPLMAMPHSPTAAEEFPYEFWHENKPFVHIHGDSPGLPTMRHQHFASSYFDYAFGNFITDPPGTGLNAVERKKMKPEGGEGLPGSVGRDLEFHEVRFEQKGDTSGWKTDEGRRSLWGDPFSMLSRNQVSDQISSLDKSLGHETGPSPMSTTSEEAVFLSQPMQPILRFYHRPKSNPRASKPNSPLPAIIVPASFSTVEHSADSVGTIGHRHMATQSSVIDADIPFIEPADLKDAEPIGIPAPLQQKNGLGQATAGGHFRGRAEENGHQQQKLVLKSYDHISSTTVSSASVLDTFDDRTIEMQTTKIVDRGRMVMVVSCGEGGTQRCATGMGCAKCSAGLHCPSPKNCCCCANDKQKGRCSSCNAGECADHSASPPNLWLSIRCCCCHHRRRSIRKEQTSQSGRWRLSTLLNRMPMDGKRIRNLF